MKTQKTSLLLLYFIAASVHAGSGLETLSPKINQSCHSSASKLIDRPEFTTLLEARPIDKSAVCKCAERGLMADEYLVKYLTAEDAIVNERMSNPKVQGYLVMRLFDSMMKCLQPEIASTLKANKLPD